MSNHPFILPRSIKRVKEISGDLVVKSELPPRSGSTLEAVEFHPLKGAIKFFFIIILGNQVSTLNEISTGIPQGSVLGPLVFLIYINHLYKCIKYSKTYHFLDDTSIM